ncbi:hypothetical protein PGT21_034549 [Puccinia graminis f. sp. tritici]|nr:hypothetical protein PGT21_034549 [Puccinia graminis f. sp. tritici]
MRFSSSSKGVLSTAKLSSIFNDDDLRPLSDESEPEGISLSDEEGKQNHEPHRKWPQDELSPRFEGVFQSTKELCILLGAHPPATSIHTPLTAKHASSQLLVSVHHTPSTHASKPDPTSMDISFHVDLQHISTRTINQKTAFVLAIPEPIAKSIVSAQWSPLNGDGVIETQLPLAGHSKSYITPSSSPPTNSPMLGPSSLSKNQHELDLLNTAAPFLDSKSEIQAETTGDDSDIDLNFDHSSADELPCSLRKSNQTLLQNSRSTTHHQFIVWIDTEWLIRRAVTTHNSVNSRLVFNLRGQLEIAASSCPSPVAGSRSKRFPIPFLILPSVDEHICECQISTDFPSRPDLRFTLPPWAYLIEQHSDDQSQQLRLSLPKDHSDPTDIIIAHLDQLNSPPQLPATVPIIPESATDQPPSSPLTRLTEPSLSINHLIINSASRIKYHSRRSTISSTTLVKKRPRLYGSLRYKSNKTTPILDKETPSPEEEHPRVKPSIRSVQVDLVVDRSSGQQSVISQYAEICITFCRSSEIVDPNINVSFPTEFDSRGTLEIIGVWIGEWELIRDQGFQVSETSGKEKDGRLEESTRFVNINVDVNSVEISSKGETGSPLPTLRMIVSHKKIISPEESEVTMKGNSSFICLLPSVDTSVAAYKAQLRSSEGFQIQVKHSNMIVPESSPEMTQLIRYALPASTSLVTPASIKSKLSLEIRPKQVSNVLVTKPREVKDQVETRVEESENCNDAQGPVRSTSWVEQCVLRWGLNWKTVLLCWLIYLVSSMSIQVEQIGTRLKRMENQRTAEEVPIELRKTLLEQMDPELIFSNSGLVYPVEEDEEVSDRSNKPARPQFMDLRLKKALLRSFLTPQTCARQDPIFTTDPPSSTGAAGPADPHKHPAEPPPPRSQPTQQHQHSHASTEIIKDFLGFFDRLFYLSISQPLSKLADSIGSFRQKLNFKQPSPPKAEF